MPIKNIQTSHLVHDLKNPVNIIETGARSLLEKQDRYGPLNAKQEKVVKRMLRNALKTRALINSMLEIDKAAMGLLTISECTLSGILKTAFVEVFDVVDPVVADALEESNSLEKFLRLLSDNQVYLEADASHLNRQIRTDETKMCLIITNLLSNAFKYKQKNVYMNCHADGQSIRVSVRDDGPGIPESFHKQIFDQYFQCVKVEGFPVRGHGLGLAGALALTEALGGNLSLCRTEQGAEFVVRIKPYSP
ncbi:MAG: sensor histidine kinase [Pseudomonadota bacterium]